jgi:glycosyltransferase involved in cell wall biosynthesis
MPTKRFKILFTIPNFDTAGSGKAMLKIIQRLNPDLFEPHIACNHDRGAFFKVVQDSGIPIHIIQTTTSMKNKWKGLWYCWKMRKFYQENHFDLVHSFHYSDDYSEALSVRLAGKKWVFVKKNMNWGGNGWKLRSFFSNGILAQNSDMMKFFFPRSSKVVLCSRGVDLNEFHPQPPHSGLVQEFGIAKETKVILTVANLVPLKGIEVLLDAVEKIVAPDSDVRVFIVGEDKNQYGEQLKQRASNLSVPVLFTGKRMDISAFHSISTIFVLPTLSKGEGSPVSFLEAMASGTFSLGSKIPGISDQLKNLPQQLFEAGNAQILAEKIQEALSWNDFEMKEKIEAQLKIVQNGFTIEQEVQRHENFYLKVLGKA